MMMIRQNSASVSGSAKGTLYPADLCTWVQELPAGRAQVDLSSGVFYGATALNLGDDISLGYIGKSGKFTIISG